MISSGKHHAVAGLNAPKLGRCGLGVKIGPGVRPVKKIPRNHNQVRLGGIDGIHHFANVFGPVVEVKRTFSFFKISCVVTAAISVLCMAVILIFPDKLAAVFSEKGNVQVMQMTVAALLLFAPSYLFTWFNMVTSAFLTAMDKPKESMIIMLFRTVLLPVSCLVILTSVMGVYGVFSTITLSSLLTCVLAGLIWRKTVWSYAR